MSDGSAAPRRPVSKKGLLLFVGVVLVVAVFGFQLVSQLLFAPWSLGYFGRDTLTGNWVGTLQARQGAEYGLYLDLDYKGRGSNNSGSRNYGSSNLRGKAILCTQTGDRYEYEVAGNASRSGDVETLRLEYGDPKLSALNLRLNGQWQSPELRLEADANPFLPDGRFDPDRILSSDDPDDSFAPFALTKGDTRAHDEICQQIES